MNLTNKLNLPQPMVDAVRNDPYTKGDADYSITGLLKPARIAALEKAHQSEITEDVADRIWSLVGQVVHGILERAERTALAEKRLYTTIAGKRISGAMDRVILEDATLQDYKFVTLWKLKKGVPREFEEQQNCYRYLLHKNGITVSRLELICIFRDWHRPTARRDESYPEFQVQKVEVPLWTLEATEQFLLRRIAVHECAQVSLPLCSSEERWATSESWAIKKKSAKKAVKIYFSKAEAEEHAHLFGGEAAGYTIEYRPGENKRCNDYCRVSQFCTQFKKSQ